MFTEIIEVENIKCSGCENTIKNALEKVQPNADVSIDIEAQTIKVSHSQEIDRHKMVDKLGSLGYPERGHNNLFNKAKSVVSCAIGRMSDDKDD